MNDSPNQNKDGKSGKSGDGKVDEAELSARLDDLNTRIQSRRKEIKKPDGEGPKGKTSNSAGIAQAMRLSSEFIAAICVGAGIGYLIDQLAGSSPWGMIVFLFLGFGAGVLNVLRVAGLVADTNMHLGAGPGKNEDE